MSNLDSTFDIEYEQRRIKRSFALYNVGIFCSWAAYNSIFNLQASINVEDGLGTTTFAVSYVIQGVLSFTLAPIMLKKFGAKVCCAIGYSSFFLFILSNIYPTYYTLLPASVLMFTLLCTMWPSMSMLNVLYAKLYTAVSKKSIEHHNISFSGYFYTTFQSSIMFGNLMSYILLYGLDPVAIPLAYSATNCTQNNGSTCDSVTVDDYQYCGINDCQNATIIEESIEKYKPVNRTSFYILLAVCFVLVAIATSIQVFLVPNDKEFHKKTLDLKTALVQSELQQVDLRNDHASDSAEEKVSSLTFIMSVIKMVAQHCCQLKYILLVPISLYNPLAMSFVYAELTRSLSSCVLGFQWVGICMCLSGLFDAIFSWIVAKFGRRIGRIPLFLICCIMDCGNYAYVMYWTPNSQMVLSIVAIFITFGITDGILQTIINVTHIDLFPEKQDIVVIGWNILIALGFSIGLGLSRLLCVSSRVYVNIGFLLIGTIGAVAAELYNRQILKKKLLQIDSKDQSQFET